jgi:endonuclease G, mitochondrial
MLNLSGGDKKQLREAIQSAYPDPADLAMFVDESLNQSLACISTAGSHSAVIFDLITKWAIPKGYIDDLILALAKDTNNPEIQRFCGRVLREHLQLQALGDIAVRPLPDFESADWDLRISGEELQGFIPRQLSFEADVGELQRGLELAGSVCKITFVDRSPKESGTGVLIAPGLVLTNYHVFSMEPDADLNAIAPSARFEFGYISSRFGERNRSPVLQAKEQAVVAFSPINQLDYVLVRLDMGEDLAIEPVPLDPGVRLTPKSPLNILQHPDGDQMKVSLSNDGVVKLNASRGLVLYVNQTECGSSGSPCFDRDWNLVALHHKELATSFGSIREGILFSAIYKQILSFL